MYILNTAELEAKAEGVPQACTIALDVHRIESPIQSTRDMRDISM
jgi:hypothetical protein